MPKRSKQARAREFNEASRKIIKERDLYQCIFCHMEYHMEDVTWYGQQLQSIMHYIPRSRGGLGIPQMVHWAARVTMRCWITETRADGRRCCNSSERICRTIIRTGARMP